MELLILLVERKEELVTREDIAGRLWGKDVFVDVDQSINRVIRKLRLALNDDPDHPQFLETVVGKGYRFVGPLELVGHNPARPATTPATVATRSRRNVASILLLGLAAAGIGAWLARPLVPGLKSARSIAVLPLQNLSGDPAQDYLADAMTETLITDIAKVSSARVISHTTVGHYRTSGRTLPDIARELSVDAIVEGSVVRDRNRVRITVQLIEGAADRHLWAETYERTTDDVLGLQDDVAREIARQLQSRLSAGPAAPSRHRPAAQAQDMYLQGLHEADKFSREGLDRSVVLFQQAVATDPQFAQAWAGLARSYSLQLVFHYGPRSMTQTNGRVAAEKAVQLDPGLSEAHAALGSLFMDQWSWAHAEEELRRSIALNASNAEAHQSLGYQLCALGRFDEGIAEMRRALELDPLSPSKRNSLGAAFYWSRHYEEALRMFRDVPDADANIERRHRRMAEIYEAQDLRVEAVQELVRALDLTGRSSLAGSVQSSYRSSGYAAAKAAFLQGDIRERQQEALHEPSSGSALWLAGDYVALRDRTNAFRWLEQALAEREQGLMYLKVEPRFEPLHDDPRFADLVRRIGLN